LPENQALQRLGRIGLSKLFTQELKRRYPDAAKIFTARGVSRMKELKEMVQSWLRK